MLQRPCVNNTSIRTSAFHQEKGVFFPIFASVFWKVDHADKVTWTKGFVAYDG
jgi:hypothetical protein